MHESASQPRFKTIRTPGRTVRGMRTLIATLLAIRRATGTAQAAPLDWTACDDGFQCATAQVPLDYDKPAGKQIGSR